MWRRYFFPGLVLAILILKAVVEERFFLGDLANGTPPIVWLVLTGLLLVVAAARKRWREVGFYAAALVAFAALDWRPSFGPGAGPVKPAAGTIRFLQLNAFMQINGSDRLAELIRKFEPDVVTMQEADVHDKPGPRIAELRARLPDYQFAHDGQMLTAVRGRVERQISIPLTHNFAYRPLLLTHAEVKGRRLVVGNVHLVPQGYTLYMPTSEEWLPRLLRFGPAHRRQAEELHRVVPGNAFLVGDFNHTPQGIAYRLFRSKWQDGFEAGGQGLGHTIEIRQRFKRIDYVLVPRSAAVLNAWVPDDVASDHLAVIVDVARDSLR
ncbi:MAG: endonuclease/exonuclease/phosphatase family protein [Chthonomonas sp.]|nr:endonuclease/exonuclease/phosphatase family protein [Chthonomonas sp.]